MKNERMDIEEEKQEEFEDYQIKIERMKKKSTLDELDSVIHELKECNLANEFDEQISHLETAKAN